MPQTVYIAVHGGAGVHSPKHEASVKRGLKLACTKSLNLDCLRQSEQAQNRNAHLELVETAITVLEDEPHFNAGYGSNLTLHGTVECDASIIDGHSSDFGSVGAVSGIKNPIRLARSVLEHSRVSDTLGRIPPLTLVSSGAYAFVTDYATTVQTVLPSALKSPRAEDEWKRWRDQVDVSEKSDHFKGMQDTVGAVAWYCDSGIAAGVSSGGILLKHPGRIGEAAVFGAGCWAQQPSKNTMGMACSVSGAGEHVIRSMLARAIGDAFNLCISKGLDLDPHDILRRVLTDMFWRPCKQRGVISPEAGVLLLTVDPIGEGKDKAHLWCAFTTPSMSIAYASSENPKPKAIILRRPKNLNLCEDNEPQIFITAVSL